MKEKKIIYAEGHETNVLLGDIVDEDEWGFTILTRKGLVHRIAKKSVIAIKERSDEAQG